MIDPNDQDKETIENTNELEVDIEAQKPLTKQEFFNTLDKVVKADLKRKSPDKEKTKTSQ